MGSAGALTLRAASNISGYARGIDLLAGGQKGKITLDNGHISNCQTCIHARGAEGAITITNSSLRGGAAGSVGIIAPAMKMRSTLVADNFTGIVVDGSSADLGTSTDPGNNTIRNNLTTGVQVHDTVPGSTDGTLSFDTCTLIREHRLTDEQAS